MALTKIDNRGLKTPIDLLDNEKIRLGTGNDLELYHDGTDSHIYHSTAYPYNDLKIRSTADIKLQTNNTEDAVVCNVNGSVDLYYDNSKKFQTTSVGCGVTGNLTFADSGKAIFGAGDDLEIYHDGSSSYISDVGTGSLKITTNGTGVDIQKESSETIARFIADGAVELYHDNSKKLETHSAGVKVSAGNLYLDRDDAKVVLGAGDDLQIYHDTQNWIKSGVDGTTLHIDHDLTQIRNHGGTEVMAKFVENGVVELYYDNTKRFETTTDGVHILGKFHAQLGTATNTINRESTGDQIIFQTTGTARGSISSNGSTVAYNTSTSDRTLKKNFQDWTDSVLPHFKALKPQTFNFTFEKDDDAKHKGYIAQDNVAAFPEAYPKNNDDKYVFNPSGMTIYLMKALQESIAKIETLETKVAALEAA